MGSHPLLKTRRRVVRLAAPLTFLLSVSTFAENAFEGQRCEDYDSYRHIRLGDPGHPNKPLRQENITDDEVREVQQAALGVYPDSIVSISGVTDGCDCEDGSRCTAQVWLALYRDNQIRSLVLSKIDGHWKLGAVQSWWLEYSAHQAGFPGIGRSAKQLAWQEEKQQLLDRFPVCPEPPAEWMLLRSEGHSSTCVDMSSLKASGSIRRVSFKHVTPRLASYIPPPKGIRMLSFPRYSILLVAFDCKDHRTRIDEGTAYYDDGTAEPMRVNDPVLWDLVRPDTVSAADMDLVCGWASRDTSRK